MSDSIRYVALSASNKEEGAAQPESDGSGVSKAKELSFQQAMIVLSEWDFAPYPPMAAPAMQRITTLLSAVTIDEDRLVGAIGVVYVPVKTFMAEAYLQVVFVDSAYRKKGIGRSLLLFAVRYLAAEMHVVRIRLHTMRNSIATKVALDRRERLCAGAASTEAAPVASSSSAAQGMIVGWSQVYESIGFKARRYLDRYYSGGADAVEYILEGAGLAAFRKPQNAAVDRKRFRD